MSRSLLFVTFLVVCYTVYAGPSIPSRYDGFLKGNIDAPVHLELYFDLMCPDCKAVWPVIKNVMHELDDQLLITLHLFPLPYHYHAFQVAQAAQAMGQHHVWTWMEAVFQNQDALSNEATTNMTFPQLQLLMNSIAVNSGIPSGIIEESTARGYDLKARASWKYGCYRSVFGTPTFHVNGIVMNDEAASWNAATWLSFLNGLVHDETTSQFQVLY